MYMHAYYIHYYTSFPWVLIPLNFIYFLENVIHVLKIKLIFFNFIDV